MANAGERRQLSHSVATDDDFESDFERKLRSARCAHQVLDLCACGWGVLIFVLTKFLMVQILSEMHPKCRS